jgi:hypothetical protein
LVQESAKVAFRNIIGAAATASSAHNWPADALRGIADLETERDARIIALAPFSVLTDALANIPLVCTRIGTTQEVLTRIGLQLVYEYFKAARGVDVDEALIDRTWANFLAEMEEANWTSRGVANLRNFSAQIMSIDLGDGISIRGRKSDELRALGFSSLVLDRLKSDWGSGGASSFVIVAETASPKNPSHPSNLVAFDSAGPWTKAIRAIGTLRLLAPGDLGLGPMWVVRAARFEFGMGGVMSVGVSIPSPRTPYLWAEGIGNNYASLYGELAKLEKVGYDRAPGNLNLALRGFMSSYDRWPVLPDSKLVDLVTALEAILGIDKELAFTVAFRVASLLAGDDGARSAMFKTVKGFYDTRSAIVHGSKLKPTHLRHLEKADELRGLVRRLLRAFVAFAARDEQEYSNTFFEKDLDAALMSAAERDKLRRSLGLG